MEYMTNNKYTECATNNEYTEHATNNDNKISNDLVSETRSFIQIESSSNSGQPPADIWEEFNSINIGTGKYKEASYRYCKVPKEIRIKVLRDIQTFDNSYFEDYTKALNSSYDLPKYTALAISILDSEAANIIIKVDKELNSYSASATLREEIIFFSTLGRNLKLPTKTQWSTAWNSCESILHNEANIKSVRFIILGYVVGYR
ncbi:36816_t:CDS:2 [Gigaspora margarita]|uniref:36816_t:CDS:1 n=1 Tax=Gigaspora margarita TaxID=4874 RepID=A0ABN7UMC2_GIGMA|nr:36816_t:CDS:2 [Gigaspora margarita]